jgi:hypothetical protein
MKQKPQIGPVERRLRKQVNRALLKLILAVIFLLLLATAIRASAADKAATDNTGHRHSKHWSHRAKYHKQLLGKQKFQW